LGRGSSLDRADRACFVMMGKDYGGIVFGILQRNTHENPILYGME
jgi:hypothetical protein